jgi:hypothetical protein
MPTWRTRYNHLTTWTRLALEAYAIDLTANHSLQGATKIRILGAILQAEGF